VNKGKSIEKYRNFFCLIFSQGGSEKFCEIFVLTLIFLVPKISCPPLTILNVG